MLLRKSGSTQDFGNLYEKRDDFWPFNNAKRSGCPAMKTITLRALLREPLKVKRWTAAGESVRITDRGQPLWIIQPAATTKRTRPRDVKRLTRYWLWSCASLGRPLAWRDSWRGLVDKGPDGQGANPPPAGEDRRAPGLDPIIF
jgi:antitoxin (DNA-binding transcriptional repressor) of toxin-antitoxin stability system